MVEENKLDARIYEDEQKESVYSIDSITERTIYILRYHDIQASMYWR